MRLLHVQRECLQTMNRIGLVDLGWTFGWLKSRKSLGLLGKCTPEDRSIVLNPLFVAKYEHDTVHYVFLHELAHALAFVATGEPCRHDDTFRLMCARLGILDYTRVDLTKEAACKTS